MCPSLTNPRTLIRNGRHCERGQSGPVSGTGVPPGMIDCPLHGHISRLQAPCLTRVEDQFYLTLHHKIVVERYGAMHSTLIARRQIHQPRDTSIGNNDPWRIGNEMFVRADVAFIGKVRRCLVRSVAEGDFHSSINLPRRWCFRQCGGEHCIAFAVVGRDEASRFPRSCSRRPILLSHCRSHCAAWVILW